MPFARSPLGTRPLQSYRSDRDKERDRERTDKDKDRSKDDV